MSKPLAFVIMPFEPAFDAVYEQLVMPALDKAGYCVKRADRLDTQQNVLRDIIQGIVLAELVVADVTTLNPNVFYELGVAHALERPTIIITQKLEELPFDLRSYRVLPYNERFDGANVMALKLAEAAAGLLRGELRFGNPVPARDTSPVSAQKRVTDDQGQTACFGKLRDISADSARRFATPMPSRK